MEKNQVDKWIVAQVIAILLDVALLPFIRIVILTMFKKWLTLKILNYNLRK